MLATEPAISVIVDGFSGPLDLLLRLIERAELDITTIALARVTDDYLAQVRALSAPDPAQLSAFMLLAARLLVIKSRALLPRQVVVRDDEPDDGAALVEQLRAWQVHKRAAIALRALDEHGGRMYRRSAAPPPPVLTGPVGATAADLVRALERRVALADLRQLPMTLPVPRTITVVEMSARIIGLLDGDARVEFRRFVGHAAPRIEIVVALWSVLELLKRRAIAVEQHDAFGPIEVWRRRDAADV
ncbi:MAG: segregation/condensation protein A [Chloroflexi bacterium]|nr:segregation/condensation protein A [Chloroflexota bacterium]